MKLRVGDIYWFEVFYPKSDKSEIRPVVISEIEGSNIIIATFATISTSEIEDFEGKYDKWKSPIFKWEDAGLKRASYVKANCVAEVEGKAFYSEDYIGKMSKNDLKAVQRKIDEFIESDEEGW